MERPGDLQLVNIITINVLEVGVSASAGVASVVSPFRHQQQQHSHECMLAEESPAANRFGMTGTNAGTNGADSDGSTAVPCRLSATSGDRRVIGVALLSPHPR